MIQTHPSLYPAAEQHSSVKLSYYYNTTQIIIGSLPAIENNENLHFQMSLFSNWDSVENSIFNISLHELSLIPEFFLALTAVILITHCSLIAYNKRYNSILLQFSVTSLCILILFLTFLLYFHEAYVAVKYLSFEFSFLSDSLGFLSKIITVMASLVCMYLLQDYIIEYKINSTEYDLLMLYAILGLTMLITANDFGTIFLALELQSLSLYMLSGFKKNSIYSIESGLKYFILGALSASYFLLGWSLLYGISGLFVLLGFHFFLFNIFSDVSTKGETNYTQYKTHDENKSENELTIISVVTPLSDLFFENSKGEEINRVLIPFSNSFTVLVKLTRLFCCDCFNTPQTFITKSEPLFVENEFLKLYASEQRDKLFSSLLFEELSDNSDKKANKNFSTLRTSRFNDQPFDRISSSENSCELLVERNHNIIMIEKNAQREEKTDVSNSKAAISKKAIEIKPRKLSYNKKSDEKTDESRLTESSLTLILISFFFKLAVAPFHLWSLDIYEGSLTSSTIFFAVVTKFSVIVILIKICYYGFYSLLKNSLYQSIIIASASSILVGSVAGLTERKLKSLLAYSSINNIGYILLALTIGTLNGVKTTLFYLVIYISSSLATWSGLVSIQLKKNRYMKKQNKEFGDIVMLRKTNPILTLTLQIALFSTAGLPPFIGFLTKMNVFLASIESHIFLVSLVTILLSIISTFYYLRLVKIMCFEKILVGKLYKPIKIKQATVNTIFSFFLPYQFCKPWLSIFFSYKVVIC